MSKRALLTRIIIPTLLISGLIIVLRNNPRESAIELSLAQQHIDFGVLPEWEGPVTRSVTARNVGKNTLRIQRIHIGCSYAEITGPEHIHPDAAAAFRIGINPEILPADQTSTTATIFTDSPKTPSVALTIVATARRFATLNPDICDFGNIRPETTHQQQLKLAVNAPLNTTHIRLLPSNHPRLTWEMIPDPDTDNFFITIQLGPLKDKGPFSSLLTVAFPNERTLALPITAEVMAPVMIHPQTLSYRVAVAGTQPSLASRSPLKSLLRCRQLKRLLLWMLVLCITPVISTRTD